MVQTVAPKDIEASVETRRYLGAMGPQRDSDEEQKLMKREIRESSKLQMTFHTFLNCVLP